MRRLMWFALGMGAGCALCAYWLPKAWLLPTALILAAVSLAVGIPGRKHPVIRRAAVLILGCAGGLAWFSCYYGLYLNGAVALDGQTRTVALTATGDSWETDYGAAVEGSLTLEGRTYPVCAYLDGEETIQAGDRIQGSFRFRVTTPDGAEAATYHQGNGIFLLAYQEDQIQVSRGVDSSWRTIPARLRRTLVNVLNRSLDPDTLPFAKALLLGDTDDLNYGVDTALKVSGIRHVAAVSGLHVSILVGLLTMVTFRKRYLLTLVGLPVLAIFAAAAGFTPSVTRACIMSALMLLAQLGNREYDGPTALSAACLLMLLANPLVITSVGFQLSVSSVAGIFLISPRIRGWLLSHLRQKEAWEKRAAGWLAGSVSVSLGATVMTAPLCAGYFGMVSLIGPLTNLLTLWFVSLIFYGLVLLCIVGTFWQTAALALSWALNPAIRLILWAAKTLSGFPLAAVYTRSPYIVGWLLFAYLLLAVFLLSRNRRPGVLSGCAVVGLCCALLASWAEPLMDGTRLTVLDVGQGQCILLQSHGRTFMVDCGGDTDDGAADAAASALLSQGISRLDGLILTHFDRDHAGGVDNLLSRVRTDLLILPAVESGLADREDTQVLFASQELSLSLPGGTITIYPPLYPGDGNETSLCVLFDSENCDILITGDRDGFGERSLLRNAQIPQVDILIAGHHGSKNATCEELLQAVRPKLVCISVGRDNPYGHPAPELLQRLEAFGCQVYRTDVHGDILYRR